jgi:hypothetical protein
MDQVIVDMHGRRINNSADSTIKPYVYVCVVASAAIIMGFIWDISWHMSIGRDRFFTPPHCFIYTGATIAGCFSGYEVLRISFWGSPVEKAGSIKFWGIFYSSLGGLLCIWGAMAMLTSAPYDNWWHNTYGLDTKILSPPHTLLLTGMITIQLGAYISVVAAGAGKSFDAKTTTIHNWIFAIAAGSVLSTLFTLFAEILEPFMMHSAFFYCAACALFPLYLFAVSRASKTKWGATAASAVFMAEMIIMVWILEILPAKPLLGPVFNHIDHYQPFRFPLLLIFPSIAIDVILDKLKGKSVWLVVPLTALAFLLVLLLVQWYFGQFYHTSVYSRGWVFASYSLNYASNPLGRYRYAFDPAWADSGIRLVKGLIRAYCLALISGTLGYFWGGWIKKVQR